jgi:hypothetical protein
LRNDPLEDPLIASIVALRRNCDDIEQVPVSKQSGIDGDKLSLARHLRDIGQYDRKSVARGNPLALVAALPSKIPIPLREIVEVLVGCPAQITPVDPSYANLCPVGNEVALNSPVAASRKGDAIARRQLAPVLRTEILNASPPVKSENGVTET